MATEEEEVVGKSMRVIGWCVWPVPSDRASGTDEEEPSERKRRRGGEEARREGSFPF